MKERYDPGQGPEPVTGIHLNYIIKKRMKSYQEEFIEFAIANGVLCFGDYTLKSGRRSPYFFNCGLFNRGDTLLRLGHFYSSAIATAGIDYDMLFGPAYKGIPLASSVAIALAEEQDLQVPFCFNRKETKDHGEGGSVFGAPIEGRVMIIDDVISAGTSVNLSVDIIRQAGAQPVAVTVAMDRQERGNSELSAVQEVEQRHGLRVINIITLDDIIAYLERRGDMTDNLEKIRRYRQKYGIRTGSG